MLNTNEPSRKKNKNGPLGIEKMKNSRVRSGQEVPTVLEKGMKIDSALSSVPQNLADCTYDFVVRFDTALHECDFMRKWPGYEETAMRRDLRALYELAASSQTCALEDVHVRAYHVMMVLEAKRAHDERLAGLFCEDWFDVDSPLDVFRVLAGPTEQELQPKVSVVAWRKMDLGEAIMG
uniref:Uncharacterized protein n=1 Tax=Caenorhabditis japonica TaxID=281687 RepID=A0A8R1DVI3_CAEJA